MICHTMNDLGFCVSPIIGTVSAWLLPSPYSPGPAGPWWTPGSQRPGAHIWLSTQYHHQNIIIYRQFAGPVVPSVMVVGTKLDLVEVGCRREVGELEAREAAESMGALYMGNCDLWHIVTNCEHEELAETSAKQGLGVEEAFKMLSKDILDRIERGDISLRLILL